MKAVRTLLDVIPLMFKSCLGTLLLLPMVDGISCGFFVDLEESYDGIDNVGGFGGFGVFLWQWVLGSGLNQSSSKGTCWCFRVVFARRRRSLFSPVSPRHQSGAQTTTRWCRPTSAGHGGAPRCSSPTQGAPLAPALPYAPYSGAETPLQPSPKQRRHLISYFHLVGCSWWLGPCGSVSFTSSIRLLSLWLVWSPPVFPSISWLQTQ